MAGDPIYPSIIQESVDDGREHHHSISNYADAIGEHRSPVRGAAAYVRLYAP